MGLDAASWEFAPKAISPLSMNCLDPWPGKADVAHHILPVGSEQAGGLRAPSPGSEGRGAHCPPAL